MSLCSVGLASSAATSGQSTRWSSGQDPSPGIYISSAWLLQLAALRYHGQLVPVSAVDPECGGATSDGHQAMRPHFTSSVTFALAASKATGRLQTGYFSSHCTAKLLRTCGQLRAHRWLLMPLSALGRCHCSHCSANLHSARRQEIFGGGTESMEQSSRHTAKTWHWICAVQTTFKGICLARLRHTSNYLFIMRRV